MQGNCKGSPDSSEVFTAASGTAPLRNVLQRQCLLVCDRSSFRILGGADLWLDGLYIRLQRGGRKGSAAIPSALEVREASHVWLTNFVIQGSGTREFLCDVCGVYVVNASVYAEGETLHS